MEENGHRAKEFTNHEQEWEKSQVPHWEETFVVLQVPCFAGSWASTENGGSVCTFLSALL